MGVRNVLVTGGSATGKSTVCRELRRRGLGAVDGDRDLAYQGDPVTGEPLTGQTGRPSHWNHVWDIARVRVVIGARDEPVTYFCGDARNLTEVRALVDRVVVLMVDEETLIGRLSRRPSDEFGAVPHEWDLVLRLHDAPDRWPPDAIPVDATQPVHDVVDEILGVTWPHRPI